MSCVISKIKELTEATKVVKMFLTDAKKTLEEESNRISYKKNLLEESAIRNLLTGLSSDLTYNYAVGLGKRQLAEAMNNKVTELVNIITNKGNTIAGYSKKLTDAMKTLEGYYVNAVLETRWLVINSNKLYQDYFVSRLKRDFEPSLNSVQYRVNFVLTVEKLILIYREHLNKLLTDDSVNELNKIRTELDNLLDITQDLSRLEAILPNQELLEANIDSKEEKVSINIQIRNQEATGALIRELAMVTPELDKTAVDLLDGLYGVKDLLDKVYHKLTGDIQVVAGLLQDNYTKFISNILPKVQEKIASVTEEFVNLRTTDKEFEEEITRCANLFITLSNMDNLTSSESNKVANQVANNLSDFITLYHLYYHMLSYSIRVPDKYNPNGPKEDNLV